MNIVKSFFRSVFSVAIGIYIVSQLLGGIQLDSLQAALLAGVAFTLLNWILKPALNLLLLPFNLITFGLFSWIIHIIVLYLVELFVPGFQLIAVSIPPFEFFGIAFTGMTFGGFWGYVFFAFVLSTVQSILLFFV